MPKYSRAQLERKTNEELFIIAYDDCPFAYDQLPTSRKHLIELLLNCSTNTRMPLLNHPPHTRMPMWINLGALGAFLGGFIILLSGALEPMGILGSIIVSLVIAISTGILINWLSEIIKPSLPTGPKLGMIGIVSLSIAIVIFIWITGPQTFIFSVEVIDQQGQPVSNAQVRIQIQGYKYSGYVTDANGGVKISIDKQHEGDLATIIVDVDGYDTPHRVQITDFKENSSHVIRLRD
ncbi:hypothetical protein QUF64_08935 [Anaerolineales bacterium HSG6]|nr:hypothetical protein [Anaerolineales bacterium HSG6]